MRSFAWKKNVSVRSFGWKKNAGVPRMRSFGWKKNAGVQECGVSAGRRTPACRGGAVSPGTASSQRDQHARDATNSRTLGLKRQRRGSSTTLSEQIFFYGSCPREIERFRSKLRFSIQNGAFCRAAMQTLDGKRCERERSEAIRSERERSEANASDQKRTRAIASKLRTALENDAYNSLYQRKNTIWYIGEHFKEDRTAYDFTGGVSRMPWEPEPPPRRDFNREFIDDLTEITMRSRREREQELLTSPYTVIKTGGGSVSSETERCDPLLQGHRAAMAAARQGLKEEPKPAAEPEETLKLVADHEAVPEPATVDNAIEIANLAGGVSRMPWELEPLPRRDYNKEFIDELTEMMCNRREREQELLTSPYTVINTGGGLVSSQTERRDPLLQGHRATMGAARQELKVEPKPVAEPEKALEPTATDNAIEIAKVLEFLTEPNSELLVDNCYIVKAQLKKVLHKFQYLMKP
ncbi:hypothetical protein L596_012788 [Steinernema carpocapsae]|uniref:Uncharacterized protein n=1 Tax=Steinernema carpocapsae TaxID=34508 RepID=A0A4U5NZ36_STECR|nr:hypothetical protein L596_012788 [Steinernema carpocapsae]